MGLNMTKIMLVEDDKSLREIYGIRLIAEGYEIKSAGDGEEALAMAIKERPDLIISDVMMPKISGFDMLDILRATPETKDIKIIMMTALSSEDQRARGESLGANRYLVKSQVGIEDVVRTVHDVLADTPVATVSAAQLFGSPAPSATANPQTFKLPAQPVSTSAPTSSPEPMAEPTPSQNSMMPQPTAPFSSPAPASLGDRIIKPIPPITPAPVVNIPQPVALPPQPTVEPAPAAPVLTPPVPVAEPTPIAEPSPVQDVVAPPPITTPIPDIASLMTQELNSDPNTPQSPVQ